MKDLALRFQVDVGLRNMLASDSRSAHPVRGSYPLARA